MQTEVDKILVVDVCGTLFRTNTTAGFVRFCVEKLGRRRWLLVLSTLSSRRLPFRILIILLGKLLGTDIHKALHLRALSRLSRDGLSELAEDYAILLKQIRVDAVFERISELTEEGWRVILVSNSIDTVIERVAIHLGLPFLSSSLAFTDDMCEGKIKTELRGQKLRAVMDYFGGSQDSIELGVITDNRSDIDLIDASKLAIVVLPAGTRNWSCRKDVEIIHK